MRKGANQFLSEFPESSLVVRVNQKAGWYGSMSLQAVAVARPLTR
jgi:hypothetical protein